MNWSSFICSMTSWSRWYDKRSTFTLWTVVFIQHGSYQSNCGLLPFLWLKHLLNGGNQRDFVFADVLQLCLSQAAHSACTRHTWRHLWLLHVTLTECGNYKCLRLEQKNNKILDKMKKRPWRTRDNSSCTFTALTSRGRKNVMNVRNTPWICRFTRDVTTEKNTETRKQLNHWERDSTRWGSTHSESTRSVLRGNCIVTSVKSSQDKVLEVFKVLHIKTYKIILSRIIALWVSFTQIFFPFFWVNVLSYFSLLCGRCFSVFNDSGWFPVTARGAHEARWRWGGGGGGGPVCVSVQPPERRAGRRRAAAAAASSPLTDTDLLFVSRPRHGRRSPAGFLSITADPVRAAVQTEGDGSNDDHEEDSDDVELEPRSGNKPQTESVRGAGASRSDAAEKSPLFGCAADGEEKPGPEWNCLTESRHAFPAASRGVCALPHPGKDAFFPTNIQGLEPPLPLLPPVWMSCEAAAAAAREALLCENSS